MKICKQCFGFFENDKCVECGSLEFHDQPVEKVKEPVDSSEVPKTQKKKAKEKQYD